MLKISYAGCFGLSPAISAQFTLTMCVAARNREKFTGTETPYFVASRSFKVIGVDSPNTLVTCVCYDTQHVCTYLQPFLRATA